MIPLHPQPCPGRPLAVRWVLGPGRVPFVGPVAAAPGALGALLGDGVLTEVRLEADAVVTGLAAGRTWPAEGARVRTAVHRALEDAGAWVPGDGAEAAGSPDVVLRAVVEHLLDGDVGALARSHGGSVSVLDVRAPVVRVRLGGRCEGCPASWLTVRFRLEAELRRRCPGPAPVVTVAGVSRRTG